MSEDALLIETESRCREPNYRAWQQGRKSFIAHSTGGEGSAALNLACRFFDVKQRNATLELELTQLGPHLWRATPKGT